jgi:phage-related protein
LKTSFTNAFTAIKTKVQSIINNIKTFVTNCINTIKELPQKVVNIGKNLVEGLWNGINDKIGWVKNKIAGMGTAITNAIKGVFGIASPSKVFAGIGGYLAEGLGVGFENEMDDVKNDMVGSMEDLTGSMTADVTAYGAAGAAMYESTETNIKGGDITINVYGAEGQSVDDIAEAVAEKLEDMTRRKGAIYA